MAQIRIKASMLESERKSPQAYGRILTIGDENTGGGSHGMFACMVDLSRAVHLKQSTLRHAIRELHTKFLRFKAT